MTTIAFDGITLATDRASWNGWIWVAVEKISVFELGVAARKHSGVDIKGLVAYAGAGDGKYILELCEWLKGARAVLPTVPGDSAMGILVDSRGHAFEVTTNGMLMELINLPVVSGGGGDIALGAMLYGASAVRAVELTSERSQYSAGGISEISVSDLSGDLSS